jgi:hypothetical protein
VARGEGEEFAEVDLVAVAHPPLGFATAAGVELDPLLVSPEGDVDLGAVGAG